MPKGTKFKSGYATVTNTGMGYREIAETMTKEGHKMNHAKLFFESYGKTS